MKFKFWEKQPENQFEKRELKFDSKEFKQEIQEIIKKYGLENVKLHMSSSVLEQRGNSIFALHIPQKDFRKIIETHHPEKIYTRPTPGNRFGDYGTMHFFVTPDIVIRTTYSSTHEEFMESEAIMNGLPYKASQGDYPKTPELIIYNLEKEKGEIGSNSNASQQ